MKRASILALALACAVFGQQRKRLTLEEAEAIALKTHPAVRSAEFQALAAGQVPKQVGAAQYPTFSANLTGVGAPTDSRLAAGGLNNPIIYSRVASGITASQLLLDFGRTSNLVKSSKYTAMAEQQRTDVVRSQVLLNVDTAYLEALRADAVLQVAEQTVAARQLVVDQVTELAKARLKSELDLSFATVSLEEAKLLRATAENERQAARANLTAALGAPASQDYDLVEVNAPIEPFSISDLVSKAMANRPDLRQRLLEEDAAAKRANADKKLILPSVSAFASAGLVPGGDQHLKGRYGAIGLNVSLPLLDGGLYHARAEESRYREDAARESVNALREQIRRDVTVALANVSTAAERVDLSRQLLAHAQQSLDLAQSRYDLGLSSIVELSQAQLARTSAAIQNANARYEYQIARAVLENRVGRTR